MEAPPPILAHLASFQLKEIFGVGKGFRICPFQFFTQSNLSPDDLMIAMKSTLILRSQITQHHYMGMYSAGVACHPADVAPEVCLLMGIIEMADQGAIDTILHLRLAIPGLQQDNSGPNRYQLRHFLPNSLLLVMLATMLVLAV